MEQRVGRAEGRRERRWWTRRHLERRASSATPKPTVLLYEFKADLNAYLARLGPGAPVRSLEDVIAFNERNRSAEMPYFGQELFVKAEAEGPADHAGVPGGAGEEPPPAARRRASTR